MKRILITGANSYIGASFERYVAKWPEKYQVDTIDMHGDAWKGFSFAGYDSVFHVAGIAHVNETEKNRDMYYSINRNLAIEVANKAKNDGVKQFVFLSSMSVYGMDEGIITRDTIPVPKTHYGISKLQAEDGMKELKGTNFKVATLRPPMVYGPGCKGNYVTLSKYAKKFPFFPDIDNQRSMIYITNLCEFVRFIIEEGKSGIYFPQNKEYVKTSDLVKEIASVHGKSIVMLRWLNVMLVFSKKIAILRKVFGSLAYEKSLSYMRGWSYETIDFITSIKESEL